MSYYKEETLILPPYDDNNNSNGMNQTFHYIPKDQKFQSNFMKNRTKSNNNNDALNSAYAMNQTFHHMPKNSNNNNQSNSNNISKKNVSNVETHIHESWAEENEYQYFIKNCTKSKSMCAIRLKDTDETTMWINLLEEILHSNEA